MTDVSVLLNPDKTAEPVSPLVATRIIFLTFSFLIDS